MKSILCIAFLVVALLAGCTTSQNIAPSTTPSSTDKPAGVPGPDATERTETFNGSEFLVIGTMMPDGSSRTQSTKIGSEGSFHVSARANVVVVQATWTDPTNQLGWWLCVPVDGHALEESSCKSGASPLQVRLENLTGELQSGIYVPLLFAPNNLPSNAGASFNVKVDWNATVTYHG